MTFVVIWGRGGKEDTTWVRVKKIFGRREAADAQRDEIVAMGYPAYTKTTKEIRTLGMPEGPAPAWDYKRLRWKV